MGNIGERVEKAEASSSKDRCPDCGGLVIFEELYPGGEVRYPFGPPCKTCGSKGTDGKPGKIIVDMTGSQDRPRDDGDTRGDDE